jgi:preprotein translocase subunit YajC
MKIRNIVISTLFASCFLLDFAFAADEAVQPLPPGHMTPNTFIMGTIQFLIMAMIVYFLMVIHPNKTRQENHSKFVKNLKKNDEVVTSSGVYGRVAAVKTDHVSVEIASNVKIRVDPAHLHPVEKEVSKADDRRDPKKVVNSKQGSKKS